MGRLSAIGLLALAACFAPVSEPTDGGPGGGSAGTGGGAAGGTAGSGGAGASGGGGAASSCQRDSDCGRGNICQPCGGGKACVPGCRTDAECARPTTCQHDVQCTTCPCPEGFCAIDPCLDVDNDGFVAGFGSTCSSKRGGDCNDTNANVNPAATERCSNGLDDDCDGLTDGNDPSCKACTGAGNCMTAWDCGVGTSFCDKQSGTVPVCCKACPPMSNGGCMPGFSKQPHGIDPMTGCGVLSCIPDAACPENFAPVCGMNGQTYGNTCELQRAGVELLHVGECVLGENLECGENGPAACGSNGTMYCRDACPICDAWVMRCTKVGVCVHDSDCPAGAPPPPALCPDGGTPRATCVTRSCNWSCQ